MTTAPVRQSTLVRTGAEHAFDSFVRNIGTWWPLHSHARDTERARTVTIEPRVDGRVYETTDDGREADWGRVLAWNPPHGFTMRWANTTPPTEVELLFTPLGPALTRVELVHRGWEAFTDAAERMRNYDAGWASILRDYQRATEAVAH